MWRYETLCFIIMISTCTPPCSKICVAKILGHYVSHNPIHSHTICHAKLENETVFNYCAYSTCLH